MCATTKTWRMKALTDLWTGDRNGNPERLITTGLLGSIRWWVEVVVRGLGGSACDPSNSGLRCPDRHGRRCVVCELFGCTSWARKFRFDVLDADGHAQQDQIKQGNTFQLVFTPLRPVHHEEWALLSATIRVIADYAAIGGKTVYKPSDELALADASVADFNGDIVLQRRVRGSPLNQNDKVLRIDGQGVTSRREVEVALSSRSTGEAVEIEVERNGERTVLAGWIGKRHHKDYGLIQRIEPSPDVEPVGRKRLEAYVGEQRWRRVEHGGFAWASFRNFWCVSGRYLSRQSANQSTFNRVIGRPQPKNNAGQNDSWLAGRRARSRQGNNPEVKAESKKVFSSKQQPRTFGFTKDGEVSLDEMKTKLRSAWHDLDDAAVRPGDAILKALLDGATR